MEKKLEQIRCCIDCGKTINFKEFCQNHPLLKNESAKEFFINPIMSIYCPSCYFERPEKPYKVRRRTLTYYNAKFKS